jgi:hypothetical protein
MILLQLHLKKGKKWMARIVYSTLNRIDPDLAKISLRKSIDVFQHEQWWDQQRMRDCSRKGLGVNKSCMEVNNAASAMILDPTYYC